MSIARTLMQPCSEEFSSRYNTRTTSRNSDVGRAAISLKGIAGNASDLSTGWWGVGFSPARA